MIDGTFYAKRFADNKLSAWLTFYKAANSEQVTQQLS